MDAQQAFTLGQQGLGLLLTISAPILLVVLAVGLVVSVFQAATQIHEATLSFVPKVVAAVAVLAIAGRISVGTAVFDWTREALGITVNEMFGQTEINYIVGNCGRFVDAEGRSLQDLAGAVRVRRAA